MGRRQKQDRKQQDDQDTAHRPAIGNPACRTNG
jgi:hypothetical protein